MLFSILQAPGLFSNLANPRETSLKPPKNLAFSKFFYPVFNASQKPKMSTTVIDKENRRIQRYALALPARVEVKVDNNFSWSDITRLEDVSAFGCGLNLKRPVKRGRLLQVSVPMPRQLRCYDYLEPQYKIWGLVRRCISIGESPKDESYAVGLAFVGKNPPKAYLEDPSKLFDLSEREDGGLWQLREADPNPDESDLPAYLRRHTRFSIPETLLVEMLDENGDVAASEVTVTENISVGGAAVFTSFDVTDGAFLRVKSERHDMSIISIVRGRHVGADGIVRLHLEFIDHLYPLEGIGS